MSVRAGGAGARGGQWAGGACDRDRIRAARAHDPALAIGRHDQRDGRELLNASGVQRLPLRPARALR